MIDIETYRAIEYAPQKASIAGLPEQVGLDHDQVLTSFLTTSTLDEAKEFVADYLKHIQDSIDPEFANDAVGLTRRHLIDQMYFAHAPVELKENHPISQSAISKRVQSKRLIVEAMILLLNDTTPGGLDESIPSNREYSRVRDEILEARKQSLSA